ncbi:MAG: TPM domain-containing protein [Negativicutes bacterium]|nr:TPM domain-containing protein [Negativicutes bacterium]
MVKHLRRGLCRTLGLVFLLLLGHTVLAADLASAGARVFDDADLFTAAEEQTLEQEISKLRTAIKMDIVVLTSTAAEYSANDSQAEKNGMAFADDFYDQNGFGSGEAKSGLIYFIDMSNRMPIITTCGAMIHYITDARLETMLDAAWQPLADGDFAASVSSVLQNTKKYVESGIPEGSYQYDTETGLPTTTPHKALTVAEAGIAAGVGAVAAAILYFAVRASYRLQGSTYHYDPGEHASVQITGSRDDYLRTSIRRIPRPRPPVNRGGGGGGFGGNRSGTHVSGGGVTHGGGGGRRF